MTQGVKPGRKPCIFRRLAGGCLRVRLTDPLALIERRKAVEFFGAERMFPGAARSSTEAYPSRGMVARRVAPPNFPVDARLRQARCRRRAQPQVIEAETGVSG